MRISMYYSNNDVRLEGMPIPKIGPGELLLKVETCGICGSDTMEWYRRDRVPLVLGHEIGAKVAKVGEGVEDYRVGDRITAAHHVPCNACYFCRSGHHTMCDTLRRTNFDPGGFSEYLRLPAINVDRGVFRLPDELSYEEATFIEPLACVLRGQRQASIKSGQSVLIIGSGLTGLLHIRLARTLGTRRVVATDVSKFRLKAAKHSGADAVINATEYSPECLRQINQNRLADLVIVCTGATSALNQALQSVERGGTVLLFAPTAPGVTVALSVNDLFWRNDVTLTTTYAASPADYAIAMELIRVKRVSVADMISHRLGLTEAGDGFKLVAEANNSLKVIIKPQE
ncbi:zinc-dependent dehydrogenase [Chloroflexota bacterium]